MLMVSFLMQSPAMALGNFSAQPFHTVAATSSKVEATAKKADDNLQSAYGSVNGDSGQKAKGEDKELEADGQKVDAMVMDKVKKDAKRVEAATN